MSWSECFGYAMAFSAACQRHILVQHCCGSGNAKCSYDAQLLATVK